MANQPTIAAGQALQIEDGLELASVCNALAATCGKDQRVLRAALQSAADLLTRQHLMLLQANLIERTDLQPNERTH
jgi:hypothetical protein